MDKLTRGIRNNNPANIRRGSSSSWVGLANTRSCGMNLILNVPWDASFCQFKSVEHGIRALIIILRTYFIKRNVKSINDLVNRFAPASDGNSPTKYAASLVRTIYAAMNLGLGSWQNLHLGENWNKVYDSSSYEHELLRYLCAGICLVESNYPLPYSVFVDALKMTK